MKACDLVQFVHVCSRVVGRCAWGGGFIIELTLLSEAARVSLLFSVLTAVLVQGC